MLRDEDKEFKQRKFMGNMSFCRNENLRWRGRGEEGRTRRRFISILAERGEERQDRKGGAGGGEMGGKAEKRDG